MAEQIGRPSDVLTTCSILVRLRVTRPPSARSLYYKSELVTERGPAAAAMVLLRSSKLPSALDGARMTLKMARL